MPMKRLDYASVRSEMRTGDVIAFGGRDPVAVLTRMLTRSVVTHVGIIVRNRPHDSEWSKFDNYVVEAKMKRGVVSSQLSHVVRRFDGEIWWLPLSEEVRKSRFSEDALANYLSANSGAPFDPRQALTAMIDRFDKSPRRGTKGLTYNEEDLEEFFCAELVAAALEHAGAVPAINASEVSPADLCRWAVYEQTYIQLLGAPDKRIDGYNSDYPSAWQRDPDEA